MLVQSCGYCKTILRKDNEYAHYDPDVGHICCGCQCGHPQEFFTYPEIMNADPPKNSWKLAAAGVTIMALVIGAGQMSKPKE